MSLTARAPIDLSARLEQFCLARLDPQISVRIMENTARSIDVR